MNWILFSRYSGTAIIITPEEAEIIMMHIHDEGSLNGVHLLTYAAPVTRRMVHFDTLNFFAFPALPTGWRPPTELLIELGIFAGRLYFDYKDAVSLRDYLQLHPEIPNEVKEIPKFTFTRKPLAFLQEWLTLRRKGQDFTHTPMGYLCLNKTLLPTHSFFQSESKIHGITENEQKFETCNGGATNRNFSTTCTLN